MIEDVVPCLRGWLNLLRLDSLSLVALAQNGVSIYTKDLLLPL